MFPTLPCYISESCWLAAFYGYYMSLYYLLLYIYTASDSINLLHSFVIEDKIIRLFFPWWMKIISRSDKQLLLPTYLIIFQTKQAHPFFWLYSIYSDSSLFPCMLLQSSVLMFEQMIRLISTSFKSMTPCNYYYILFYIIIIHLNNVFYFILFCE